MLRGARADRCEGRLGPGRRRGQRLGRPGLAGRLRRRRSCYRRRRDSGAGGFVRRRGAGSRPTGLAGQKADPAGKTGLRRRRPVPADAGLGRGVRTARPPCSPGADDPRRHRGAPPLAERARHHRDPAVPGGGAHRQRERHGRHRGNPLRRQRPPRRPGGPDDRGRPPGPAQRYRRSLHRRPAPRPFGRSAGTDRGPDAGDRRHGRRRQQRRRGRHRRHGHQAGGSPHRPGGRVRYHHHTGQARPASRSPVRGRGRHLHRSRPPPPPPPTRPGSPAASRRRAC